MAFPLSRNTFNSYGLLVGVAILVVLLTFVLRVFHLDTQSVWFDEGWSWRLATLPFDQMARVTAADRSPFLYYALLHGWLVFAGDSEFAMRFMSVCADGVTVALVIALSRALAGGASRLPWLAGLIYAICPFAVWYGQETRMYALVAAFCMASCYWLWRWLRRPARVRSLAASAVLLAGATYLHYYAIFLLPAQGLAVLAALLATPIGVRQLRIRLAIVSRQFTKWFIAAVCSAVSLVPWLIYASAGFAYDDGFVFPLNTVMGRLGEWTTSFADGGLALAPAPWWPIGLLGVVLVTVLVYAFARRWRALVFIGALIAGSLFAAAVAVRVVYPYRSVFHPRYLIYVVPLAIVFIGCAPRRLGGAPAGLRLQRIASIPDVMLPASAALVLATLWLPALYANYFDPAVSRDNVRLATRHVVEALAPGDVVVMTRDNYAVRYYLHRSYPEQAARFLAMPEGLHGVLNTDRDLIAVLNAMSPRRVRLFLWQDAVVDPQRLVESTLWANGYEMGEVDFGQIRLPLYQIQQMPLSSPAFTATSATFGRDLALTAYWMRRQGQPGNWFYAVLEWKPLQKLTTNYKAFVHVLDSGGQTVFQRDKLPLSDLAPMSSWAVGETVRDAYAMVIPAALPTGDYRVVVGVYDPAESGRRLAVTSTSNRVDDDAIILGTLQVRKR